MSRSRLRLEFPPAVSDDTPLEEVFDSRFRDVFERLHVTTVGELKASEELLTASEVLEMNAWLARCWWYW